MTILAPVATIVRDAYGTNDNVISSNATVFYIIGAVLDIPSVFMLDSGKSQGAGMAIWFKIACAVTILG